MADDKKDVKKDEKASDSKASDSKASETDDLKSQIKKAEAKLQKALSAKEKADQAVAEAQKEHDQLIQLIPTESHADRVRAIQAQSAKQREAREKRRKDMVEKGFDPKVLADLLRK